jgi:hypothetical protein
METGKMDVTIKSECKALNIEPPNSGLVLPQTGVFGRGSINVTERQRGDARSPAENFPLKNPLGPLGDCVDFGRSTVNWNLPRQGSRLDGIREGYNQLPRNRQKQFDQYIRDTAGRLNTKDGMDRADSFLEAVRRNPPQLEGAAMRTQADYIYRYTHHRFGY